LLQAKVLSVFLFSFSHLTEQDMYELIGPTKTYSFQKTEKTTAFISSLSQAMKEHSASLKKSKTKSGSP